MKQDAEIIIFDTTLRDGEQSPGATMTIQEKVAIAEGLDAMGVDIIEAGFAIASPGDFECVEAIAKQIKNAAVCSLARAKKIDIEAAAKAVACAKRPRIHTFISTSKIHLEHQFKMTETQALDAIQESVSFARNFCDDVEWSAMDATRTHIDYLARAVETAIQYGARTINIPDTVGYTMPHEFAAMIRALRVKVPNIDQAIISVHCHNDLGLAVANSLAAIDAGARQVECTINGIGERAGNAALEEIIMAIKTRQDIMPYHTHIDTTHIARMSKLVSATTGFAVQKNKAIVGANAFAHESGIHQDGILKARETYEIMRPESIGLNKTELVMGKHSGRAAFKNKLAELNINIADANFEALFLRFKALGDRKKQIMDKDIFALIDSDNCSNDMSQKDMNRIPSIIIPNKKADYIWIDGEFMPWEDANVHSMSHGIHYGSAVFEGERAYAGKIFKSIEHSDRFQRSANMLDMKITYSSAELNVIKHELLRRNRLSDAYVRPIAWRGVENLSVASHKCSVHVAIAAWSWGSYFGVTNIFEEGLKLMWADWVRPAPNMAPVAAKAAGLYIIGSLSKNKAEQQGFHDALMLDYRGYVAECSGANFFMVIDGEIHTPIADCFLDGITRRTAIDIARYKNIKVIERYIEPHEIKHAEEVFITGTAVEICPVGQIGEQHFKIGPISKMIAAEYADMVRR
jgi:2-isopropylmalate synthase